MTPHAECAAKPRRALHLCYLAALRWRKTGTFQGPMVPFQVLFFGILRDLGLADSIPLWYSRVDPKPLYESPEEKAYWDVPVFAEHEHLPQSGTEWTQYSLITRRRRSLR